MFVSMLVSLKSSMYDSMRMSFKGATMGGIKLFTVLLLVLKLDRHYASTLSQDVEQSAFLNRNGPSSQILEHSILSNDVHVATGLNYEDHSAHLKTKEETNAARLDHVANAAVLENATNAALLKHVEHAHLFDYAHLIDYAQYIDPTETAANDIFNTIQGASSQISDKAGNVGAVSGVCKEGVVYTITSYEDLLRHINDLPCIFSAALTPDSVPTGFVYGRLLELGATALFNPLVATVFQGDFISETRCQGKQTFLGELRFAGKTIGVGELKLGRFAAADRLAAYEAYDSRRGGDGLIFSFSEDLYQRCGPDTGKIGRTNFPAYFLGKPAFMSETYPTRLFTDLIRFVGRAADGASLYLGRTFVADPLVPDAELHTAYYFFWKSYDPTVQSRFASGQALPPVPSTFSYILKGPLATAIKAEPFHFLASLLLGTQTTKFPALIEEGKNNLIPHPFDPLP